MTVLRFEHVSKRYRISQRQEHSTKPPIIRDLYRLMNRSQDFWALRDINFEVQRGEALGIIGHNGAGKSTILKLLSSITSPTSGQIMIQGHLSALIEVGSGFHPDLTGRENIYLSGSILGMRRREITEKLDSIIDFAGVRNFVDTPVKRYSSGMYVRLGFSIAAHLQPDILLLDEVLAVGDAAFQAKCFKRVSELKESGATIVFISHDLAAVELLCDRVLLLSHGEIALEGDPHEITVEYQRAYGSALPRPPEKEAESRPRQVEITALTLMDGEGHIQSGFNTGSPLRVQIEYFARDYVPDVVFEVFYYSADGKYHCQYTTALGDRQTDLVPGAGIVEFYSGELGLQPGLYYVDATIKRRGEQQNIDWNYRCATLCVDAGKTVIGRFYTPHQWEIVQRSLEPMHDRTESSVPLSGRKTPGRGL